MVKILKGLDSTFYEHDFDKMALEQLKKVKGFDFVCKKILEYGIEKFIRIQYTGSSLKVNEKSLPSLYNALVKNCEVLDINKQPEMYLSWDYSINGFTTGEKDTFIVLNSGAIDLMSEKELNFIIGHELGHVKSKHVLYHMMSQILPVLGDILGNITLGIGNLISESMKIALNYWSRMSEFTADRAGLLACQDFESVGKAILKMSGLPIKYYNGQMLDTFMEQAQEFTKLDFDPSNKIMKILLSYNLSHPWTIIRYAELYKWYKSEKYQEIISNQNYNNNLKICQTCKRDNKAEAKFCYYCGTLLNSHSPHTNY